jgi:hypothetical protein
MSGDNSLECLVLKRGALIFAALSALAIILTFIFRSTNEVSGPARLTVMGFTNANGTPRLIVSFPRVLHRPHRPPYGHKGWSLSTLELSCTLPDGTITKVATRHEEGYGRTLQTNGPHLDRTHYVEIPPGTKSVRINKAETILSSFQDIAIPVITQSSRTVFTYEVPESTFAVGEPNSSQ